MTVESPWAEQATIYHAREDRRMLERLGAVSGVLDGPGGADLKVTSSGSGLGLSVAAGEALVAGSHAGVTRQGLYPVAVSASETVFAPTANATNPRIDQVVLRIRDTEPAPASAGDASNDGTIEIVTGTPTAGATLVNKTGAGTPPASSLRLAWVLTPAAFTGPYVTATHVLDARQDTRGSSTVVTALPANPADRQVIDYLADASNGVVWRFKYRAAASGSFKWEFIGGGMLWAEVQSASTRANAAFGDPTVGTAGPSITVPLAGDYEIVGSAKSEITATGVSVVIAAIKIGAAATSDNDMVSIINAQSAAAAETSGARGAATLRRTVAAADVVKLEYRATAGTGQWSQRQLAIRPIRVG